MNKTFPSAAWVRSRLSALNMRQIAALAELSEVPAPTIYKIRLGATENPGIETCRKIIQAMPLLRSAGRRSSAQRAG